MKLENSLKYRFTLLFPSRISLSCFPHSCQMSWTRLPVSFLASFSSSFHYYFFFPEMLQSSAVTFELLIPLLGKSHRVSVLTERLLVGLIAICIALLVSQHCLCDI